MQPRRLRFSTLVTLLLATGGLATGAADLPRDSDSVFVGRVLEQESEFSEDGRFILTRTRFRVQATLKGEHRPTAEVVEYGGRVGDKWLHVTHGARYRAGREYVVFARLDSRGWLRTLEGWKGHLQVLRDDHDSLFVKVPRGHPVRAWLPGHAAALVPLESVIEQLDSRLRRSP